MRKPPSLLEFEKRFADEASCAEYLFEQRWPEGFVCPTCGGFRALLLKSRAWTYQCLDCRHQTSVTAGTVMHRSKLPLRVWFWAAHLMATHSNGMSALQLKGQLGISYRAAWLLTQKLRRSMVDPQREPLEGVVEIDQTEIPFRDSSSAPSRCATVRPERPKNQRKSGPDTSTRSQVGSALRRSPATMPPTFVPSSRPTSSLGRRCSRTVISPISG